MQLGVRNDEAAALAEANGMKVVMNRCPKIEYGRLSSEIAWMGVNTRTLSSKKATIGGIQRMTLNRTSAQGGATTAADRAQREEGASELSPKADPAEAGKGAKETQNLL
jgi:hypothetical protein